MNCRRSRREMEVAVDVGERRPADTELDRHLSGCDPCRDYRRRLDSLGGLLRSSMPTHKAPAGLRRRVLSLARTRPSPPRLRPWLAPALSVAAALAVVLVAGRWLASRPSETDVQLVRFDLPAGTRLVREPEIVVLRKKP